MKVKFNKFPSEVDEIVKSNNSAKMALSRLESGTKDTQRTWFRENESPEQVIAPVVAKLNELAQTGRIPSAEPSIQKVISFGQNEARPHYTAEKQAVRRIAEFDLSKIEKFQAQGRTAPFTERLETFDEYFQHLETPPLLKDNPNLPYWKKAKQVARKLLGFNQSGAPLSIREVVDRGISDQKYNTNSGYPLFRKRKSPEAIAEAMASAEGNNAILNKYPFMVGSRAQMGKVGKDARFIFMAPMAVNICGQRFAQPVQEYLTDLAERRLRNPVSKAEASKLPWGFSDDQLLAFFTPWLGWDKVQDVISQHWYDSDLRFGADYSKMDQHFNIHHAMEVYDVIKYFFSKEYWSELKLVMQYPFRAPIITSEGYVDQEHALLSGSEWTNLIETVWNFIFIIYLCMVSTPTFISVGMIIPMGIGDDQLWMIRWRKESTESHSFQDRAEYFLGSTIKAFEMAGLPGNPDKQEGVSELDESGFLQRHMETGYDGVFGLVPAAGVYSLIRNVTSQVFPERYHNDPEYDWKAFAIRVIMIAENCCNHPLFVWYVTDYIAKANPNILKFVKLTDSEIDSKWNTVKNMAGFRPNYNQEKQDKPLTQFLTFKLLRALV